MIKPMMTHQLCYTQELIDALIAVNEAATKMQRTDESKAYYTLRSALYDSIQKFPAHEKELADAKKHVEEQCDKFCKDETTAFITYKENVGKVCDVLKTMLAGKFIVSGCNWINGMMQVKNVSLGGYCENSVVAYGDWLDFTAFGTNNYVPKDIPIWAGADSVHSVASHVAKKVNEGEPPVSAEGTIMQMVRVIYPDDAIVWLNERKKFIDKHHESLISVINAAKKVENDKV